MFGFALRQTWGTFARGHGVIFAPDIVVRNRLVRKANSAGTYRERQRRRVELGVGTLADYAWYGTEYDWQRARTLTHAGHEDLI